MDQRISIAAAAANMLIAGLRTTKQRCGHIVQQRGKEYVSSQVIQKRSVASSQFVHVALHPWTGAPRVHQGTPHAPVLSLAQLV